MATTSHLRDPYTFSSLESSEDLALSPNPGLGWKFCWEDVLSGPGEKDTSVLAIFLWIVVSLYEIRWPYVL